MESAPVGPAHVPRGTKWSSYSTMGCLSLAVTVLAIVARFALDQYGLVVSVSALSSLVLIYGIAMFLLHGAGRCTVLGLFNLAQSLFVGYPGIVLPGSDILEVPLEFLRAAVFWSLLCAALVNAVAWRSAVALEPLGRAPALSRNYRYALITAGLLLYLGATLAKAVGLIPDISYLGEGFAFVGIVSIAVGLVLSPSFRIVSLSTLVIGALFAAYTLYNHSGTGRLRIVALGCSLLLLSSLARPALFTKLTVVAASPLAVWALAGIRLAYQESLTLGSSDGRTGLESMLSPLATLAHVIAAMESGWENRSGLSYLTILAVPLPDWAQPEWMPPALGYDLVSLVSPERAGTEFSLAVTSFGEGVWNFGILGFFVAAVVAVIVVTVSDRFIIICVRLLRDGSFYAPVLLVFSLVAGGTIGDFAWNGVHTFGTRIGTRVPALVVLSVLVFVLLAFFRSFDRVSRYSDTPAAVKIGQM